MTPDDVTRKIADAINAELADRPPEFPLATIDRIAALCQIGANRTRDEIAARFHRQTLTCAYCGHEYPNGTPAAKHATLDQHIRECPQHPMRQVEDERDEALRKLDAALREL